VIKGLCSAGIWSEDIQKELLPFYRDVVGLQANMESPEFAVLGSNPSGPFVTLGTHSKVKGKNPDPARHMVGLEVDDVQTEFERLKAKGVVFIEEPNEQGGIWVATFLDPEGNYIQLLQFPTQ
jgi:predicted enzyme related to lactoylglutathione lyase